MVLVGGVGGDSFCAADLYWLQVSHWEEGGGVGTTNVRLRKGGLAIPGDWLRLLAPWSAAESVQHVCREGSLLNTFHLKPALKQQSLCLVSVMLNITPPINNKQLFGNSNIGKESWLFKKLPHCFFAK